MPSTRIEERYILADALLLVHISSKMNFSGSAGIFTRNLGFRIRRIRRVTLPRYESSYDACTGYFLNA